MGKRSNAVETLILSLEIMRRIPRNRMITAQELHGQLKAVDISRDIRTIQRHLDILSERFDIIRDDRSRPYGYKWKERAQSLSVPCLSEEESLLLALSEQYLNSLLPSSVMKSLEGFFYQAQQNLRFDNTAKQRKSREWLAKVRVVSATQPLIAPEIKPGIFETVSRALYNNQWLRVVYRNSDDKAGSYDVMPLGLAQQESRLYLVCRFKGYDNERNLALHRVDQAKVSTRTFQRPRDFNLERYDADGRFGFSHGRTIKLSFIIDRSSGSHLMESPLSLDQEIEWMGEEMKVSSTLVETDQLDWWLKSFGDRIRCIERVEIESEEA